MKSKPSKLSIPGLTYISEVQTELKKVTWPNRQQVINRTILVVIASAITGAYLGALDYGFTYLVKLILNR